MSADFPYGLFHIKLPGSSGNDVLDSSEIKKKQLMAIQFIQTLAGRTELKLQMINFASWFDGYISRQNFKWTGTTIEVDSWFRDFSEINTKGNNFKYIPRELFGKFIDLELEHLSKNSSI